MAAQLPAPVTINDIATTLPGELACAIFDHLPLRPDLIRISHVSQRWRELARTHSSFWKCVDLRDNGFSRCSSEYSLMRAQLQASEATGLMIRIDINREDDYWTESDSKEDSDSQGEESDEEGVTIPLKLLVDMAHLLKQNIHRIAQLRLNLSPMVLSHLNYINLFEMPAPLLEELEVVVREVVTGRRCSFDWSCIQRAPKLRVLRMQVDLAQKDNYKSLDYSHSCLEELQWKPVFDADIQLPPVEKLLDFFPRLRFLSLPEQLDRQDFNNPAAASARLAGFDWLGLPDEVLNLLDIARLTRVPHLYVYDPVPTAIHDIVSHFLHEERAQDHESSMQPLHVQNWPWDSDAWRQPFIVTELSPPGRVRAIDIVRYTWLPNIPAMGAISNRVTRLAAPMKEWQELIEAFCGVPALIELTILVSSSNDRAHFQRQPGVVQSPHLKRIVLQAAQKTYAPPRPVELYPRDFAAFIERAINPDVRRGMDLIVEGINWVKDAEDDYLETLEEDPEILEELMAPFFSNFQPEPLKTTHS